MLRPARDCCMRKALIWQRWLKLYVLFESSKSQLAQIDPTAAHRLSVSKGKQSNKPASESKPNPANSTRCCTCGNYRHKEGNIECKGLNITCHKCSQVCHFAKWCQNQKKNNAKQPEAQAQTESMVLKKSR